MDKCVEQENLIFKHKFSSWNLLEYLNHYFYQQIRLSVCRLFSLKFFVKHKHISKETPSKHIDRIQEAQLSDCYIGYIRHIFCTFQTLLVLADQHFTSIYNNGWSASSKHVFLTYHKINFHPFGAVITDFHYIRVTIIKFSHILCYWHLYHTLMRNNLYKYHNFK